MRNLSVLFLLISASVFGQGTLTPDVATAFVHQKIDALNLKIWNAVHTGEITAYKNDSLATETSSSEIREWSSQIISAQELLHKNGGFVMQMVIGPFDSVSGYTGVRLSYDHGYSEHGLKFDLRSYAPMFKPSTESGVTLGEMPLFWVSINGVKKILHEKGFGFYIALIKQRMILGDLMNPHWYAKNDTELSGQSITFKTVLDDHFWNDYGTKEDTAVGNHLFSLLTFSCEKLQQEKGTNIFYKDKELKNTYNYVPHELAETIKGIVPNPDNPDDPYDLVTFETREIFMFRDITKVNVTKSGKDYILMLINAKAEKERVVYVPYSSLSVYMIENDRIVLETLLQELTE